MTAAWPSTPLGEVLRLRQPDVLHLPTGKYQLAGVYSFGPGATHSKKRTLGSDFLPSGNAIKCQ